MPLNLANHEAKAKAAVKRFWTGRGAARDKQSASGKLDQGERSAVTGGKNMDGFIDLASDLVRANGLKNAEIHLQRKTLTLPGFFRPTKIWDLERYHLLCKKLMQEQFYTAATVLASPRTATKTGNFSTHDDLTSLTQFVAAFAGHIAAVAAAR